MAYEKELKNLGLTDKEALVYLASLELGAETVQNIAKKAGINRATAYLQIESLKERGLMSEFEKGKKTFFVAESPEQLSRLLNIWEKELEFKKAEVNRILPALQNIFAGAGERPKVRFLEGLEGARTLQADFLSVKDKKIESFVNLDKLFEVFPEHEREYSKNRIEKQIESKVIYTRKEGPLGDATDAAKLRIAKYMPLDQFPVSSDITIYDNKVAFATYKVKNIGVVIESKEIADTMRILFYAIWATLK
ncbi:MAG: hypothetical protein HY506_00550 [Candidatus Yanofskybacteria bacterium]|nr:hypothetical protein [Candidatus Yanofskybacteria bacterium]